jgi:hypothetical protein
LALDGAGDWWLEQDRKQTKPPRDTHALLNLSGDGGLQSAIVFIFGLLFYSDIIM